MGYSNDFRECVLKNISEGMSWNKACEIFSISKGSIASWVKNYKSRGAVSDMPRKEYKVRKIDSTKLIEAFDKKPDATLAEIAKEFNCWPQSIYKRCIKLGLTRKKNNTLRGKE